MSLMRAAARTMLASYFVINGVKVLKDPQASVPQAEPVINAIVPTVKRVAPPEISGRIPEDAATLVRLTGAVQAVSGLALATGIGRRLGAMALAATMIPQTLAAHPFWTRKDLQEKADDRAAFVKNIALLGGVLIASADLEGRPSLAWRAEDSRKRVGRSASRTGERVKRSGRTIRREAKHAAREARAAAKAARREAALAAKDVQLKLT